MGLGALESGIERVATPRILAALPLGGLEALARERSESCKATYRHRVA